MLIFFYNKSCKTNLKGEIIGSVEGFLGHLGCLDVNPEDGRLYASLEYKSDNIGKGILKVWEMILCYRSSKEVLST